MNNWGNNYNNWKSADESLYKDVPEFCRSVKLLNNDLTEDEIKIVEAI